MVAVPGGGTLAFVAASGLLAVAPGPGVLYIVSRTLAHGRLAGLASVGGVACGNALNAAGAALGLAALFAVSTAVFDVVRFAGAAYLVWLGVRTLRQGLSPHAAATPAAARVGRLWAEGLWVAALNPKTALFFAAFVPQFMDAGRPALVQALGFGAVFVLIAATTDAGYVLLAHAVAPRLGRRGGADRRIGRRASGTLLIALGVWSAVAGPRRLA